MADVIIPNFGSLISDVQKDDIVLMYDSSGNVSGRVPVETLLGGWRDLRAPLIGAKQGGVNDPTLLAFAPSGGIKQYAFAVDDEVFLAFHIDHDIKQGSTIFPHVHWSSNGASTNSVKWEIEYTITSRNDVAPTSFPAPTTITLEASTTGVAWQHIVTEHGVGFPAPEVDSLVVAHLTRVTNGATDNPDDIFGLFMDLHYEAQQYGTVSRSPDFYTP